MHESPQKAGRLSTSGRVSGHHRANITGWLRTGRPLGPPLHFSAPRTYLKCRGTPCGQYISLKDLPQEVQRREDQATRQNRETAPPDQKAQEEASGASWVC